MSKKNKALTVAVDEEMLQVNSAKHRAARQSSYLDYEELDGLPMPAVRMKTRTGKRDSKMKRKNAVYAHRTWKNETKSRAQWARHMEGTCRCYTESAAKEDDLLMRLRKDGFPVVL